MRGVAARADVSVATVSRFYSGNGPVGDEARERIRQAADALGYVPNTAARSLRARHTGTIGVVLPDLYGDFFSDLLRGLDSAARMHDRHLLVAGAHGGESEVASTARAMHGRVDGLIVMSPDLDTDAVQRALPPRIPTVIIGGDAGTLRVDNKGGARDATEHLLRLGHRRVAHLAGLAANRDAQERRDGWQAAMASGGLDTEGLLFQGDFTEASGVSVAHAVLALAPEDRPSALFAANDAMAVGALGVLLDAGLDVPADLALVGFDDVPLARHLRPALTTVRVPTADLGARAVERLVNASRDASGARGSALTLSAPLVVRASCGAAASL